MLIVQYAKVVLFSVKPICFGIKVIIGLHKVCLQFQLIWNSFMALETFLKSSSTFFLLMLIKQIQQFSIFHYPSYLVYYNFEKTLNWIIHLYFLTKYQSINYPWISAIIICTINCNKLPKKIINSTTIHFHYNYHTHIHKNCLMKERRTKYQLMLNDYFCCTCH